MKRVIDARSGLPPLIRAATWRLGFSAALFVSTSMLAGANTFNVTSPGDGGQQIGNTTTCVEVNASNTPTGFCSLRAAITVGNGITANNVATAHIINISVPLITIQNGSFPSMNAEYVLNGNDATIDGNGLSCLDLSDSGTESAAPPIHNGSGANGSTIQNINIGNCNGLAAIVANGHGYHFLNNHIGVGPDGATGIGIPPKMNQGNGIYLSASAAYDAQFIDVAGLKSLYDALPAQPVDSIEINKFSVNIATALQNLNPDTISGNVISNNSEAGIVLSSENLGGTIVTNNFIGTNSTGTLAVPNTGDGISFIGTTFGNLIGPGNVISGNGANGINVSDGTVFLPNFIMGNFIGVNGTLASHVGNTLSGIVVDSSPDSSVGHFNPSQIAVIIGPQNVIADNQGTNNVLDLDDKNDTQAGIVITGSSTGIKVIGNRIGMNDSAPGVPSSSTLFGNQGDGIIVTTKGNAIGGSSPTDANVIAGNVRHGIVIKSGATSNSILGNSIGVDPNFAGNLGLGNGVDGIHIDDGNSTTIGGPGSTDFNTIAGNGRNGIKIRDGDIISGWSNLSQRNLIYHNATALVPIPGHLGVGIDLDYTEDATDAPHSEILGGSYANFDQASPVICSGPADPGACAGAVAPTSSGGTTSLQWTIATHGPASLRMEFFQIDTTDDNTATSMTFLGEATVSTDLTGLPVNSAECNGGRCTSSLTANLGGGYILMTATDVTPLTNAAAGTGDWKDQLKCFAGDIGIPLLSNCPVNNTSEFSVVATIPAAAPSVVTDAPTGVTGVAATLQGTVTANGADAAVSFDYGSTTSYGSSIAASPATVTAAQVDIATLAGISGLTCGQTYHYRAVATNSQGTTLGNDVAFTTAICSAVAPTAATVAASAISGTSATLNGVVSADGQTTTVKFGYGTTIAYGGSGSPANATQSPLSSGASSAPVSLKLTGLDCNTLYHFHVTANNGIGGTIDGGDLTFTTAICSAVLPDVTTTAATSVSATTATLNGTVSANGAVTSVNFDFGLDNVAYGALGSPAAATPSTLTSGTVAGAVSLTATGLTCATQYHFRANAKNSAGGTVNGNDLTFTTGACVQAAPTVTTFAASLVTLNSATFNGVVSANGASTTVKFDYGTSTSYGSNVVAAQSPLSSNGTTVTAAATSLLCSTTYHFRVVGTNSAGPTNGADQSFVTPTCPVPTATTNAATALTTTGATLNGSVSANGGLGIVTFEYGTGIGYGATLTATQSPVITNGAAVSVPVTGLTCGTGYHFRVDINNGSAGGTVAGNDQTFTTTACSAAPSATTNAATAVTVSGATLNGTVSANGASTVVTFDYGTTTSYTTHTAATQSPVSTDGTAVSLPITGLSCGTLYHFQVRANNGTGGDILGGDQMFTTGACPAGAPTATTTAATAITVSGATLNGTVSANGASTVVTFDYGTTTSYTTHTAATQSPVSTDGTAVSLPITGLSCGTLYHFQVRANNGTGGDILGGDQMFTTSACPAGAPTATTTAATAITVSGATLNGTVSANGASTVVTFDYGTTTSYTTHTAATQSPVSTDGTAVSLPITGLSCGTLYHFQVRANNGTGGDILGGDQMFTTSACPAGAPTATTTAATAITVSGATLNGTVSANGASTVVTFDYGTTTSYTTHTAATQSPVSTDGTAVSLPITGLSCGTLYHFQVRANNGTGGDILGGDQMFTTSACPAGAPTATTTAATAITVSGATLNGTVSANGASTVVTFDYGTTTSYTTHTAATQSPVSTNGAAVSLPITGLSCGTLYHFQVRANNGTGGDILGGDQMFTTSACPAGAPSATTNAATAVTVSGATLNGTVSANGASTVVTFDYGTTTAYTTHTAATQSPVSTDGTAVSLPITGLSCGTLYHFQVRANNGTGGDILGGDQMFTTSACPAGAPTATTTAATAITVSGATLNGTVSANGASTVVTFDYGTTTSYTTHTAATQSPVSTDGTAVSLPITGLSCNTLYHFQVRANNGTGGDILGGDQMFTTSACAVVKTYSAMTFTNTGTATAVLSGGGANCSLSNPAFVGAPVAPPAGVTFPDGLFQFKAVNCVSTITVTVTFPTAFSAGEHYYKYGPTPGPVAAHWYTLGAGNSLSLVGNVATFTIADGGLGDDDLAVNTTIVDQGGPGVPPPAGTSAAVPAPTLTVWGMLALIGLFGAAGLVQARRRRVVARH